MDARVCTSPKKNCGSHTTAHGHHRLRWFTSRTKSKPPLRRRVAWLVLRCRSLVSKNKHVPGICIEKTTRVGDSYRKTNAGRGLVSTNQHKSGTRVEKPTRGLRAQMILARGLRAYMFLTRDFATHGYNTNRHVSKSCLAT